MLLMLRAIGFVLASDFVLFAGALSLLCWVFVGLFLSMYFLLLSAVLMRVNGVSIVVDATAVVCLFTMKFSWTQHYYLEV